MRAPNINAAARTVQDLLSPAVPLALGYVDNFLASVVIDDGGFQYQLEEPQKNYTMAKYFTICIPKELHDSTDTSPNLVRTEYGQEKIEVVAIRSKLGRPFTGFAILRGSTLYPVDVPKTLTSIRRVFRFRQTQLKVESNMADDEIKKLESKNLDEFEEVLKANTKALRNSGHIQIVRDPRLLFVPPDSTTAVPDTELKEQVARTGRRGKKPLPR